MRWVNMAVIIIFAVATLIFAVQNFQPVAVSFLNFKISAPHALLIAIIYLQIGRASCRERVCT